MVVMLGYSDGQVKVSSQASLANLYDVLFIDFESMVKYK